MPDLIDWLLENEPAFRKSRLPSLYSDLSVQKTTNPEGYSANVLAWQSALVRANTAGRLPSEQRLILHASEELLDALASSQYGRPSALGLVLDESVRGGKMFDLKDFQDMDQSIYHWSWIPSPLTVLRWGLKQAGLAGKASYDKSGRLRPGRIVLIPALEDMYKHIHAASAQKGSNLTDRVITRETFNNDFARLNDKPLSSQDVDVLLRFLARDKGILSYDSNTVKFKLSASEDPEPITSEDATIANLKSLLSSLEVQIANLNARITVLQQNAKSAVETKNKTAAISALRSKKLAERTLQQRTDTLTQLEEVYSKIEQAVDQVQIIEVMQSSTTVLKGLNKKIGGVERVEDVVEELREEMGKVDEVGQVLQDPLDSKAILDEAEVDDELEAMEQEERRKEEENEAEATRKRLAELEQSEKQQRAEREKEEEQKRQAERDRLAEAELKLKESIERLDKMKLGGEDDSQEEPRPEPRERVPEQAS